MLRGVPRAKTLHSQAAADVAAGKGVALLQTKVRRPVQSSGAGAEDGGIHWPGRVGYLPEFTSGTASQSLG